LCVIPAWLGSKIDDQRILLHFLQQFASEQHGRDGIENQRKFADDISELRKRHRAASFAFAPPKEKRGNRCRAHRVCGSLLYYK
jgi:hypothetical protein